VLVRAASGTNRLPLHPQGDYALIHRHARKSELLADPVHCACRIEKRVRVVILVEPVPEIGGFVPQPGFAQQASAVAQHPPKPGEFFGGVVKMFDHFAGDDVVVGAAEGVGIGRIERVVGADVVAGFAQHDRGDRTRTRPEVESGVGRREMLADRRQHVGDKLPVPRIIHIVIVGVVIGAFGFGGGMRCRIHEDAVAGGAVRIRAVAVCVMRRSQRPTQRTQE
jgi:hypothetical protein